MCNKLVKQNNREKVYIILMFIWGVLLMFLIPTWQTPDESTHLSIIGESLNNSNFSKLLTENIAIESGRMEFNPSQKMNINEQIAAMFEKPDYSKSEVLPKGINLDIIKHLPATLGMIIAILIELPAYWVLQFGELFSLIFYVSICYYSLKLMPIKRELFALVMILPMAMQQAGSISYDAVVLPLSYLFISYIFYLKYVKDKIVLKDVLFLLVCWVVITYIKVPYVFIICLVLILPLDKFCVKLGKVEIDGDFIKKWRLVACVLGGIFGVLFIYLFRQNKWIQIIYGMVVEWQRGVYLIQQTIYTWHESLVISSIGNFGWLDTPVSFVFALAVYFVLIIEAIIIDDENVKIKFSGKDRVVIWGTAGVMALFVLMSMVNHTIMMTLYGAENLDVTYEIREALYQIPYIGGLQGRYFLPFLVLFFIPLPQVYQIKEKRASVFLYSVILVTIIYVTTIVLLRYWVM